MYYYLFVLNLVVQKHVQVRNGRRSAVTLIMRWPGLVLVVVLERAERDARVLYTTCEFYSKASRFVVMNIGHKTT